MGEETKPETKIEVIDTPEERRFYAAAVIFGEIWPIVTKYKKTVFIVAIVELWIHSLMFRHLQDIKDISEMFPFLSGFFGGGQ